MNILLSWIHGCERRARPGLHCLLPALALLAATEVWAQSVPVLTPNAVISLEYPNPWEHNQLIALTPDGRYLVDAPQSARHIRVWDWEKKEVVKRLLLNEEALEIGDFERRVLGVIKIGYGRELAFSPDGRYLLTCVYPKKSDGQQDYRFARVWEFSTGAVVADVRGPMREVPGFPPEAIVVVGCNSISFAPGGGLMAIQGGGAIHASAKDVGTTRRNPNFLGGVILYDTSTWQPRKLLQPGPGKAGVGSRVVFSADGKEALALAFHFPPSFPKGLTAEQSERLITNQLVRWRLDSGALVENREIPKLASSAGVWWSWLPGGRELWWRNTMARLYQTEEEARGCEVAGKPAPFESDQPENCAYLWAVSVLDVESGKLRYVAPIKKNSPRGAKTNARFYTHAYEAAISPDGRFLVLERGKRSRDSDALVSELEVFNLMTFRSQGVYPWTGNTREGLAISNVTFSADSKRFTLKVNEQAYIFELPR